MSFYAQYPASAAGTNPSVGANGAPAPGSSTEIAGVNGGIQTPVSVDGSGNVNVNVINSSLPTGSATAANQVTEINDINAFAAKTASSSVTVPFDYQAITYVGATTEIATVQFYTGGSGGTLVATLTMGYDGSNRLTSITKT